MRLPSLTLKFIAFAVLGISGSGEAVCKIPIPPYSVYVYASTLKDDPFSAVTLTTTKYFPTKNGLKTITTSGVNISVSEVYCKDDKLISKGETISPIILDLNFKNEADDKEIKWEIGYTWKESQKTSLFGEEMWETVSRNTIKKVEQVKTPAGTFKTYRVETTFTMKVDNVVETNPSMQVAWYAKEVGLIKSTYDGNTMTLVKLVK